MVAHVLQVAGHIRTRRGKILILNRTELERMACECYRTIKLHAENVFGEAPAAARAPDSDQSPEESKLTPRQIEEARRRA
jgi:hypothetical protein